MKQFTNYQEAVHYLIHDVPKTPRDVFDDSTTIAKNFRIMELLGNPQNIHPAVHVAGTSGKGTICYLIDAVLRAHNKHTGMTQSPHVYDIRERIQIEGQLISEEQFLQAFNEVLYKTTHANIAISYFEALTAMGFLLLATSNIDYEIIETGMGGRLDASNVISDKRKIAVLGQIGFDHMYALGNTLAAIATEKAGIVQPDNLVVALRQDPIVNEVFIKRCLEQNATLVWVEPAEDYQQTNEKVALQVCKLLAERDGWQFDKELANAIVGQVFIPGRFEKRHYKDHPAVLDGAHNPQKFEALANRLIREGEKPASIVLALGDQQDLEASLLALKPVAKRIIATEYFTKEQDIPKRPIKAKIIADACQQLKIEAYAETEPNKALAAASSYPDPTIITGSFYLLGELDKAFK